MDLNLTEMISAEDIQKKVAELGAILTEKFDGKTPVALCVLNGSAIFYADLLRAMDTDLTCEFISVSSYGNKSYSSGQVRLTMDIGTQIEGKDVLIVEDIIDTGLTMNYLIKTLEVRKPKSITTVALLNKPNARKVDCEADYTGFDIANDFVVGYGLDYQGYCRNLPHIARVENLM